MATRKRYLGLKWQAVFTISLILILGIGLVSNLSKFNLDQTYTHHRERVFHDRTQSIQTVLKTMQLQLMRLASHMQGLASQESPSLHRDSLVSTLEKNWDQLNFEWGVDSITLYTPDGQIVSSLGLPAAAQLLPKEWVVNAGSSEAPIAKVWCFRSCWQAVVVPILLEDSSTGILVLSQSLADAVLQFQSSTAADVGILIPQHLESESAHFETRPLNTWGHNVVALTGTPTTYTILENLSKKTLMNEMSTRTLQQFNKNDYEVSLIPLTNPTSSNSATLVIIENVTTELQRLDSAVSNLFLSSLLILILAEAALLWLLWGPMSRLRLVVDTLPKLARDNRHEHLQKLEIFGKGSGVRNEIHNLFDSAILLSKTLAELDSTVKLRTRGLKDRSRELLEERNFVTTLLDNVNAVILTQDVEGNIQMLNSEGRRLLDIKKDESPSHKFLDFINDDDNTPVELGLKELFTRQITHFNHESQLYSNCSGNLFMDWRHTRLPDSASNKILLLSVGLDLTARKHAETNLAWLADHDPLTELLNRRRFKIEFDAILKKCARKKQPGALIFFDVDQFKEVNDTSGHPTGDRLLCELARKLTSASRETDIIARIGGDEFAIVVEQTDRDGVISYVEKICDLIDGTEVIIDKTVHRITISVGVVLFPKHGLDADELMANVDLAMYKAKSQSDAKSNWHIYSSNAPDKRELYAQVGWKARIQKALNEDRFVLYYQPILNLQDDTISHYEALVRMLDEKGNIIPPGMFIPTAEKTGLIYEIDRHVLNLAVIALKKFHDEGQKITMSVNLSATAIGRNDFISTVERLVNEYEIDRSHIIFELTETSAVDDIVLTADVIGKCRELGYLFALDDFGVGFSSWYYLRQLPVDFVKIDGSFVRKLASSVEDKLFINAINDVSQGLGKKTIAEFVEDEETIKLLKQLGVDYAQGYHIGKPSPGLLNSDNDIDVLFDRLEDEVKSGLK